jgi:hypothetical protein
MAILVLLHVLSIRSLARDQPPGGMTACAIDRPANHTAGAEAKSKQIATAPTLSVYGSSSLGSFTTSGPSSNLQYNVYVDGSSTAVWNLYRHVDSESWYYVTQVDQGYWTITLYPAFFYGSRLTLGTHYVYDQARDSSGAASNTISVSYVVLPLPTATPTDALSGGAIAGIVIGVLVFVCAAVILAVVLFARARQAAASANSQADSTVTGRSLPVDQKPLPAPFPPGQPGYLPQSDYPLGAPPPPPLGYPAHGGYAPPGAPPPGYPPPGPYAPPPFPPQPAYQPPPPPQAAYPPPFLPPAAPEAPGPYGTPSWNA